MRMSVGSYAAYLVSVLVVATIFGLASSFLFWSANVSSCRAPGGDHQFLAYCTHPWFGDYEHAVYGWGWRPDAVRSAREADVLFLGSSTSQVAFSSESTRQFFSDEKARYYLLGFGYGEQFPFEDDLVRQFDLRPKVIVVNTDPFFSSTESEPAKQVEGDGIAARVDYGRKRLFEAISGVLCFFPSLCSNYWPTVYRESIRGTWNVQTNRALFAERFPHTAPPKIDNLRDYVGTLRPNALKLLQEASIAPECLILTGTPNSQIDSPAIAGELAAQLHASVVVPQVDNITSGDHVHLSWLSAERWSAAFLDASKPLIERCIGRKSS